MRSGNSRVVRPLALCALAAVLVPLHAAVAVPPNATNRVHMTSKPAIVQVVAGWIARWEWSGETIPRGMIGAGTGFFIHPDGYILTNAHVVADMKKTDDEVKTEATLDILKAGLEAGNVPVTEANLQMLVQKIQRGQIPEPQMVAFQRVAFVFLQSGKRFAFEIKAFGAPIGGEGADVLTGKDVAVIKIEVKNAPTLELGDSDNVQVGDGVWVMGYPAAAESDVLDERSALEPTTNDGKISAKKTSRDGTPILQTNTATTHGNSGGPVINEAGEVVGLLTFRGNEVYGQEVQGFNFIVPINTAMEFVRQAGTENKSGPVDQKWKEGLEQYWSEQYSLAKKSFDDVVTLFPEHAEAHRLMSECAERVLKGEDKPPPPPPPPPPPATAGETPGTTGTPGAAGPAGTAARQPGGDLADDESGFPTWGIAAIAGGAALVLVVVLVIVLSGRKKGAPAGMPGYPPGMAVPGGAPPGYMPPAGAPGMPMAMPGGVPGAPAMPGVAPTTPAGAPAVMPARTEMYQSPGGGKLVCTIGPLQGRELPIGAGFFIGRDAARAQVVVQDGQVSGQHLWVGPAGGRIIAKDMGSTNGTFLNARLDQRITEVALSEGDALTLGQRASVRFVFHA